MSNTLQWYWLTQFFCAFPSCCGDKLHYYKLTLLQADTKPKTAFRVMNDFSWHKRGKPKQHLAWISDEYRKLSGNVFLLNCCSSLEEWSLFLSFPSSFYVSFRNRNSTRITKTGHSVLTVVHMAQGQLPDHDCCQLLPRNVQHKLFPSASSPLSPVMIKKIKINSVSIHA